MFWISFGEFKLGGVSIKIYFWNDIILIDYVKIGYFYGEFILNIYRNKDFGNVGKEK